jgi:hypothetical protein
VPLDKEKGFVKGKDILSGAEHRLLSTSESVGPRLWDITAESLLVDRSTIDTTETTIMILLYGHPAAESVRKWETPRCFPRRLRRLLHRPVWMREHPINVSG